MKIPNTQFFVVKNYIFRSADFKPDREYVFNGSHLVEDKESNRQVVAGEEYTGNGKPEEAIQLLAEIAKLPTPAKSAQSRVYDLAFNDLKIPIQEFRHATEPQGCVHYIPEYWQSGKEDYMEAARDYLRQVPALNKAVTDGMLENWYFETMILRLQECRNPEEIGLFVRDVYVTEMLERFKEEKSGTEPEQSYHCPKCGGTTFGVDYCDNPDCPNRPCCGRPAEECDCPETNTSLFEAATNSSNAEWKAYEEDSVVKELHVKLNELNRRYVSDGSFGVENFTPEDRALFEELQKTFLEYVYHKYPQVYMQLFYKAISS